MISVADESKVTKTFPMENLCNKKVVSECKQYLGCEVSLNSAKTEDCHSPNHSSNFAKENVPANAFALSMTLSSLRSPPPVDMPTFWENSNSVTPDKGEGETKTSSEVISQATPCMDYSVLTAADFGITPESFTKHQGRTKSILKLRRQSTIGVRGSPENNALIRYIAHQKRMRTKEPLSQASPYQRNLLLKEKIAAFQSSFQACEEAVEEMIHTPYLSKKADTKSHEQSQLDQVGPSEYKAVTLEETLNCKSTNGEKGSADIQEIPVLHPSTAEFQRLQLEATPAAGISKTACGIRSQNTKEELSSSTPSQQSCKKVRFAEKQSLEIFDETKPPITPLQKGHFPSMYRDSSCLRSVLKKTPVGVYEDMKEHLDYTNMRKGREELSVFQTCGPLQTEKSTRPVDKMETHNEEVDVKVFDTFQPVDTPVRCGEASFSPSGTRNDSCFNTTPIKTTLSQPNFDSDDGLLQETSELISTVDSVVNSGDTEDEETKISSPDLRAMYIRVTRSSAKKQTNKVEETSASLTRETRTKRTRTINKVPNPRKLQNEKPVTKSASKKLTASRRKAFGKRKREKKTQKVFHGNYETVSKKPLLSPIPEMTEDISLISPYQSTPESSVSILAFLDRSCSSLVHETPEEANRMLHSTEEGGNCLDSNLSTVKEDALPDIESCLFLQLQDAVPDDTPITFPLKPPSNNSSKDLKNVLNGQVLKSDYSSENEMELGLLNLQGSGEKNRKEASLLIADSVVEQPSGGDICVNFKRFPRRSRRITHYLPSVEDFQAETPRNNPCVPRGSMEELPCIPQTVNDSELFNEVLYAIEESFRSITTSTQKRVRRSMRQLKNAESEGLTWISVPTNVSVNQAVVSSDCKARRKSSAFCHPESEMLHQKQKNLVQTLSPMMEDQKRARVGMEHCRPRKKRKSICGQGEN